MQISMSVSLVPMTVISTLYVPILLEASIAHVSLVTLEMESLVLVRLSCRINSLSY